MKPQITQDSVGNSNHMSRECEIDFCEHFGKFGFIEDAQFQKMLERSEKMTETTFWEVLGRGSRQSMML